MSKTNRPKWVRFKRLMRKKSLVNFDKPPLYWMSLLGAAANLLAEPETWSSRLCQVSWDPVGLMLYYALKFVNGDRLLPDATMVYLLSQFGDTSSDQDWDMAVDDDDNNMSVKTLQARFNQVVILSKHIPSSVTKDFEMWAPDVTCLVLDRCVDLSDGIDFISAINHCFNLKHLVVMANLNKHDHMDHVVACFTRPFSYQSATETFGLKKLRTLVLDMDQFKDISTVNSLNCLPSLRCIHGSISLSTSWSIDNWICDPNCKHSNDYRRPERNVFNHKHRQNSPLTNRFSRIAGEIMVDAAYGVPARPDTVEHRWICYRTDGKFVRYLSIIGASKISSNISRGIKTKSKDSANTDMLGPPLKKQQKKSLM